MSRHVKLQYFLSTFFKIRAKSQKMAASALRADSTLSPTLICEYTRKIEKSDQIVRTMIGPVSNDIEYFYLHSKWMPESWFVGTRKYLLEEDCHKCHGACRVRTCEEQSAELLTVTPHHTEPNTQFNSRNTKIPQWRWEIVFVKTASRQQTGCASFETYPVINNCASVKICCCPSLPRRKGAECEADLQLLTAAAQF